MLRGGGNAEELSWVIFIRLVPTAESRQNIVSRLWPFSSFDQLLTQEVGGLRMSRQQIRNVIVSSLPLKDR